MVYVHPCCVPGLFVVAILKLIGKSAILYFVDNFKDNCLQGRQATHFIILAIFGQSEAMMYLMKKVEWCMMEERIRKWVRRAYVNPKWGRRVFWYHPPSISQCEVSLWEFQDYSTTTEAEFGSASSPCLYRIGSGQTGGKVHSQVAPAGRGSNPTGYVTLCGTYPRGAYVSRCVKWRRVYEINNANGARWREIYMADDTSSVSNNIGVVLSKFHWIIRGRLRNLQSMSVTEYVSPPPC